MKIRRLILLSILLMVSFLTKAQNQKGIDIDGQATGDNFGASVSMPDANTIAIGAPFNDGNGSDKGSVRIFTWNGNSWIQKGISIDGESNDNLSGWSVSMPDSNTIAIGAPFNDGNGTDEGSVRIYTWNGGTWIQKGSDIDGEWSFDNSGISVSMPDSNTVAIGAHKNDGNGSNSGHVRVYTWVGGLWVQKGSDIDGEAAGDQFGSSVSMPDANIIAIGADENDGNGISSGHVRVYNWDGNDWVQKGNDIDGEAASDYSGSSVSMPDANTVAIGAYGNDGNGSNSGHVRVYNWIGSAWVQKGTDINGEAAGDVSGWSVSMADMNTLAIGAIGNDDNGADAGQIRVFKWDGNGWVQNGNDINGKAIDDGFGNSVSMGNPNTVAIGAQYNDENGFQSGHVRVFEICNVDYAVISQLACSSYTSPSTNYIWTVSGNYTDTLTNSLGCDSILSINLTINQPSTGVDVQVTCESYTWIDGITYTTSNNTATYTLTNNVGCDSIVSLDLTIYNVDVTTTTVDLTITSNNTTATAYQWIDCNNNNAPINGETSASFTATVNGDYAVIVSEGNCSDTSACVNINNVGINDNNNLSNVVKIYPNPNNGELYLSTTAGHLTLTVYSVDGKVIINNLQVTQATQMISLGDVESGVYFVKVTNETNQKTIRLVVEK